MESVEDRKGVVDSINDLYAYLSEQNYIPPASARRVAEATKTLFSKKNELTPISK
jgi:hypothetical protein